MLGTTNATMPHGMKSHMLPHAQVPAAFSVSILHTSMICSIGRDGISGRRNATNSIGEGEG